jgi:hypothetical protein
VQDVADYIRITELEESERNTLNNMINVAKAFIKDTTGQEDLDKYPDFVIVLYVLVEDMWDNRSLYVDKNNLNKVVESILGLHDNNLL